MGKRELESPARVLRRNGKANPGPGGTPCGMILKQGYPFQRRLRVPGGPSGEKFAKQSDALLSIFERKRPGQRSRRIGRSRIAHMLARLMLRYFPALGWP